MQRRRAAFYVVSALLAACQPELETNDALVSTTRVLAVRATPPEVKPGTAASYEILVADPAGRDDASSPVWRWCTAPKPVAENNVVSTSCLDASSLVAAGTGTSIAATTPADACTLFGPDTPPGGFRPRSPDVTGGYYAPLRIDVDGADVAFHRARLLCNLGEAPTDIAAQYARDYVPNANPRLLPIAARISGTPVSIDGIPPGARVALTASWSVDDAEKYVYFDRASQTLGLRRESMRVAWYASAGALETESTGRSEDDPSSESENQWVAPQLGEATLWIVLRDSRGGSDFAVVGVRVAP